MEILRSHKDAVQIMPATLEDYTAIASLHARSWQKSYRGILSDDYLDNEVEKERLSYWMEQRNRPADNQRISLAVINSNIIGFSCIYLDDSPEFGTLVDNLHVLQPYQKYGTGRLLMTASAALVKQLSNSPKMYLWVFESNTNARKFYERLGGTCFETVEKEHEDGTVARVCRYVWEDVYGMQ